MRLKHLNKDQVLGNQSGFLNIDNILIPVCEGQLLYTAQDVVRHREQCKNPRCPSRHVPIPK